MQFVDCYNVYILGDGNRSVSSVSIYFISAIHKLINVLPHENNVFFFFNDTAPTELYPLPLHDAFPISTKLGSRRKAERGLAQEKGGRRGFSHAFANTGMSAMLAIAATMLPAERADAIWLAAAAALAKIGRAHV